MPQYTGALNALDESLETLVSDEVEKYETAMDNAQFNKALQSIWTIVSRSNKYIDETTPWALAKDEDKKQELANVMVHLAENIRIIAVLLKPFLPYGPKEMFRQLNIVDESLHTYDSVLKYGQVQVADKVTDKPQPIYPRLDTEEEVQHIKSLMKPTEPEEEVEEASNEITIEDFNNVELKVATILDAAPVKKADKLLKIQVDLGDETRQIVSGIAKFYKPEEIIGKKVIVVTNLKPVKLRGEMSQGMILSAEKGKQLTLISVPDGIENGSIVK